MAGNYEYFDFIKHFSGGIAYLNEYTEDAARTKFWNESQSWILFQIREYMDQGWEPITQVGPGAIKLGYKKTYFDWDFFGWFAYFGVGLATLGIGFFIMPLIFTFRVTFPEEFKVTMRRKN